MQATYFVCVFSLRFASDVFLGDVQPALNMIKTRGSLHVTRYWADEFDHQGLYRRACDTIRLNATI